MAPLWVAAAALLAAPTAIAFRTGGYTVNISAQTPLLVAAAAFVALGFVAVLGPWPTIATGRPLAALGAFAAFTAWTVASVAWARLLTEAGNDAARAVMYCAVFAVALAVMRSRLVRQATPAVLLAGIVVVALYALGGRLLPELIPTSPVALAGSRLAQPLTYWNALGILMVSGVLLSISVAAGGVGPRAVRAAACAATVPCGLALLLTYPRGALVAVAVGLVALGLVWPRRVTALAAVLGLGGAALASTAALASPAVRSLDSSRSAEESQGLVVAVVAVAIAIAAGLAFAWLERRAEGPPLRLPRGLRIGVALGLTVAVVGGGGFVVANVERTEDIPKSAGRLRTLETNRGAYWEVALNSFLDHPANGVGTGSFAAEWRRERTDPQFAADAHSMYLETLAELGLVGALLLAALIAIVIAGVVRRAREHPSDPLLPAAVGVLAALAVHLGLDWDWEMPAVTLPALILAAAVLQPERASLD